MTRLNIHVPSFFSGAGSVINLFPSEPSTYRCALRSRTNTQALSGDWRRVGGDLFRAMEGHLNEQEEEQGFALFS